MFFRKVRVWGTTIFPGARVPGTAILLSKRGATLETSEIFISADVVLAWLNEGRFIHSSVLEVCVASSGYDVSGPPAFSDEI